MKSHAEILAGLASIGGYSPSGGAGSGSAAISSAVSSRVMVSPVSAS
jgi:hypothetical protein